MCHVTPTTLSPQAGEGSVAITRETFVSFSGALARSSVFLPGVFSLWFFETRLNVSLHVSADNHTVTLFPTELLPTNAQVRVQVNASAGLRALATDTLVDADSDGAPGGVLEFAFETLAINLVPNTTVYGRVFASVLTQNGTLNEPLADVVITVDGRESELRATTDAFGSFTLDPAPAGRFFVHIDGWQASNPRDPGSYYPRVGKPWVAVAGTSTSVGDVFLPLIANGTLQPVNPTATTVIRFPQAVVSEFPAFENVTLTIPPGALLSDADIKAGRPSK